MMPPKEPRDTGTVYLAFPIGESGEEEFERLHATPLPSGGYLIENSPFYAFDISYRDVARARHQEGRLLFDGVAERGGHSTYRVKLSPESTHEDFLAQFDSLARLGCSFEGTGSGPRRLYAIDIPPGADLAKVYAPLEALEQQGFWKFEEAHLFKGHSSGS